MYMRLMVFDYFSVIAAAQLWSPFTSLKSLPVEKKMIEVDEEVVLFNTGGFAVYSEHNS
jgi:hypothetical protein